MPQVRPAVGEKLGERLLHRRRCSPMTASRRCSILEVSEDVVAAVVFEVSGDPIGATVDADEARPLPETAGRCLLRRRACTEPTTERLEAVTADGSISSFARKPGRRRATGRDPVAGLVYHDLRAVLEK